MRQLGLDFGEQYNGVIDMMTHAPRWIFGERLSSEGPDELRASLIIQEKDASNQKVWREFVDLCRSVIYRTAIKQYRLKRDTYLHRSERNGHELSCVGELDLRG